jgi:hypothetical protein
LGKICIVDLFRRGWFLFFLEKITGRFGQPALGKGIDAFVEERLI